MKRTLYKHQKAIIKADPKKTGLFLGTGTGKTRIALTLAEGSMLVICPKTQKEDQNWEREYKEILTQSVRWQIESGRTPSTIRPNLTVMSKEEFKRDAASLPRFNTVIVDEAHTCLGVTPNTRQRARVTIPRASQLYEALEAYLARTKPERLYLCTATIIRSPMTVWAAASLLAPFKAELARMSSFYEFRDRYYFRLPMPGREVWTPVRDDKSKDSLAEMVRSLGYVGRLEDFFDVPVQSFKTINIELTEKQKAKLKILHLDYPDPIVLVGKKHQVENGVLAGDDFSDGITFSNGKTEIILDLWQNEYPRIIVFAKYRAQIEQIAAEARKWDHRVRTMTGDTKDRGALLAEVNSLDQCLFIVQAQISAGWQLPEYPLMVFASRTYSIVDYTQALGRIQRANNIKKNLYINLVVKGGVDEAVDKALANKQDFDERIYAGV